MSSTKNTLDEEIIAASFYEHVTSDEEATSEGDAENRRLTKAFRTVAPPKMYCSYFETTNETVSESVGSASAELLSCKHVQQQPQQQQESSIGGQRVCLNCEFRGNEQIDSLTHMAFMSPPERAMRLPTSHSIESTIVSLQSPSSAPVQVAATSPLDTWRVNASLNASLSRRDGETTFDAEDDTDDDADETDEVVDTDDDDDDVEDEDNKSIMNRSTTSHLSNVSGASETTTLLLSDADSDSDDDGFRHEYLDWQETRRELKRKRALDEAQREVDNVDRIGLTQRWSETLDCDAEKNNKNRQKKTKVLPLLRTAMRRSEAWFCPRIEPPLADELALFDGQTTKPTVPADQPLIRYLKVDGKFKIRLNMDEWPSSKADSEYIFLFFSPKTSKKNCNFTHICPVFLDRLMVDSRKRVWKMTMIEVESSGSRQRCRFRQRDECNVHRRNVTLSDQQQKVQHN